MDFIFLETDDFQEASNDLSSLKKKKKTRQTGETYSSCIKTKK